MTIHETLLTLLSLSLSLSLSLILCDLYMVYSNACILYKILLIIFSIVIYVERSFSKLKKIKYHLRSIVKKRSSGLAVIN